MSFEIDLSGRRAVITGAGQHTGRAFAVAFARAGAEVAVNDIEPERAEAVTAEINDSGGRARTSVFDVTDHRAVATAIGEIAPDIVVANTGATGAIELPFRPFTETDPESWRPLVDVNLYGVANCAHAALPGMVEAGWGRLIAVISDAARRGERGLAMYGASKAAAAAFMRSMAVEYGPAGITANCLSFSTLRHDGAEIDADLERRLVRGYSVKRLGTATDPTGLAVLLASDHASWITGQVIPVDGGYTQAL